MIIQINVSRYCRDQTEPHLPETTIKTIRRSAAVQFVCDVVSSLPQNGTNCDERIHDILLMKDHK